MSLATKLFRIFFVIFSLLDRSYANKQLNNLTLEFVQIVWRHGDRSPLLFYKNDPYKSYWHQIPGMLTQKGMHEHYKLGEYLRDRYMPHFLNPHYLRNETYVISSNVDRAIESAQSNLAAFYAPKDWQVFNEALNWQPVPVHTSPHTEHMFLGVPLENCPRYEQIEQEFIESEEWQEFNQSMKPLLEELSKYAGDKLTIDNSSFFYDNLLCVQSHNLPLPEWMSSEMMQQLSVSANFEFFNLFKGKELQRLVGGTLFNKIREVFVAKIKGNTKEMLSNKMVIYSAHDTTIIALSRLLDVFNFKRPPYASAMIFELYSDVNKNYFIKVMYRNVTGTEIHEPYDFAMPLCKSRVLCPFDDFLDNSGDLVLDDWNSGCQISLMEKIRANSSDGHVFRFLVLAVGFIMGTFGIFFAIELYCWYIKRRVIDPSKLKLDITFFSSDDVYNSSNDLKI